MEAQKNSAKNIRKDTAFMSMVLNGLISQAVNLHPYKNLPSQQAEILRKEILDAITLIEVPKYTSTKDEKNPNSSPNEFHSNPNKTISNNLFALNQSKILTKAKNVLKEKHFILLKLLVQDLLSKIWAPVIQITCINFIDGVIDNSKDVVNYVRKVKEDSSKKSALIDKQSNINFTIMASVVQLLLSYVTKLELLAKKCRLNDQPLPELKFNLIVLKTYGLKLKCLEMEVLVKTYSPAAVQRLKKISSDLKRKNSDLSQQNAILDNKLQAYDNLGHKFKILVNEYKVLKKDYEYLKLSE